MNLSKKAALAAGFLTVIPPLYFILFMLSMFAFVFESTRHEEMSSGGMPFGFELFMLIHFSVMVLVFALLAFYVVHLFKTTAVPADKKALWAVVLFLGNLFAMPVYWHLYLWRPLTHPMASSQGPAGTTP